MVQINLAKALKIKNRLAGRLAKVQTDIQTYNSVPEGLAGRSMFLGCLVIEYPSVTGRCVGDPMFL